jgi:hypothetical protein
MLSEAILKKIERFIINSLIKKHYKHPKYLRDAKNINKYIENFKASTLNLFLPDPSFHLVDSDKLLYLPRRHQILQFRSPFIPLEAFKEDFAKIPQLHYAKIHFFPVKRHNPAEKNMRAIIYFHGWGRENFIIERQYQFRIIQKAYKADIFAFELPYHHSRNTGGFSGQGFLDGDPVRTIEAFRQAICEAYYLYKILKAGYEEVGFIGVSLGGYIVAMLNLLLSEPVFSLACLVGTPFHVNLKNLYISPNIMHALSMKEVRKALILLDFSKIVLKRQNQNFYLFGGKFDSIIEPKTVLNLGKHFNSRTYIIPSGHFTFPVFLPYLVNRIVHWSKR